MKITSLDKEIKKVFETGYYQVPRFQRPYSWEKDHIDEFWNDAIIDSESDYFIGSIVVYKKSDEIFGIVDGQQRLTTITMILCAIRDFYLHEAFRSQARGVHVLIEKPDLDDEQNYILQTETSYPYFQEYIQKFDEPDVAVKYSPEEINLKNGFEQISNYIAEGIRLIKANKTLDEARKKIDVQVYLNEIRDKVLKLKVIYIELDDEDDAYVIFETLNTRGKDLEASDLFKNYLTRNVKANNKNVDIAKDKWNAIRSNIDAINGADIDLDSFLVHFWLSKYGYTSKKALFKKLKSTVKPAQAKVFLDSLLGDSTTYQHILNPKSRLWDKNHAAIKRSLIALQDVLRVVQQVPMVLSILRNYNEGNLRNRQVREMLESIEHFHYIFNAVTLQRSSGGISSMYSVYARKLNIITDDNEIGAMIQEFRIKLREKVPSFDEFLVNFRNLQYINNSTKYKKLVHYTLTKIDKKFNASGVEIDYDEMTLEHILPQKPMVKTVNHDTHVGMIGNLVLLSQKANNKLSNKGFSSKRSELLACNMHLDKVLKTADSEWDAKQIDERTEELARLAYYEVFKI